MQTDLEARVKYLEDMISLLVKPDRYTIQRNLQVFNNVQIGVGKKPVPQQTAHTGSGATNVNGTAYFAGATYGNPEKNMLNYLWQSIIAYGLIKEIP